MYYVLDGSSHRAHAKIAALVRPVEAASHSCSNFRVLHSLPSSIYMVLTGSANDPIEAPEAAETPDPIEALDIMHKCTAVCPRTLSF